MRGAALLATIVLFRLLLGCAKEEGPPPVVAPPEPPVDTAIGEYEFEPGQIRLEHSPLSRRNPHPPARFSGTLRHRFGEPVIRVEFWPDRAAWEKRDRWEEDLAEALTVEVPGVGPVPGICRLHVSFVEEQQYKANPPHKARPVLCLLYAGEDSLVVLEHWSPLQEGSPTEEPDEGDWRKRVLAKAVAAAGKSPAVAALAALAAERRVLARPQLMDGLPTIRASIDGGQFQVLAKGKPRRSGHLRTWVLPARPGQSVTYEILAVFRRFVVSTEGLVEETDSGASPLDEREITLSSPEWIEFELPSIRRNRERMQAALLLRWGRPVEKWLDTFRFPLEPPLKTLDLASATAALKKDLEASFDPDRGQHLNRWDRDELLNRGSDSAPAEAILSGGYGMVRGRWGHAREVFHMARLWQSRPDLRPKYPLETVLEKWVANMKTHPDPYMGSGKGYRDDRSPWSRGRAIAALHLGSEAFGNDAFREARDRQMTLFGTDAYGAGVIGGAGVGRETIEVCAAFGQTAALIGEERDLKACRDFIVMMLGRRTDRARAAYELYRESPRKLREGLLAVLEGRAELLD